MSLKKLLPERVKRPLRKGVYYARYLLRRAGGRNPLLPPPWLHDIGEGFEEPGREFLGHFTRLGGLEPGDRVLDIGSGTGRMALPLTTYLTSGSYDGVDIVLPSVQWCARAYRKHPNFHFHHSDIYNKYYNDGPVKASEYKFPFADASFDFIFLTSVFTHMLTSDVRHYLGGIRRIITPSGTVFMTAFLLNAETRQLIAADSARFSFSHPLDGCLAEIEEVPERATAYEQDDFLAMVEESGLTVRSIHFGTWRGTDGPSFQDFVIAGPA